MSIRNSCRKIHALRILRLYQIIRVSELRFRGRQRARRKFKHCCWILLKYWTSLILLKKCTNWWSSKRMSKVSFLVLAVFSLLNYVIWKQRLSTLARLWSSVTIAIIAATTSLFKKEQIHCESRLWPICRPQSAAPAGPTGLHWIYRWGLLLG